MTRKRKPATSDSVTSSLFLRNASVTVAPQGLGEIPPMRGMVAISFYKAKAGLNGVTKARAEPGSSPCVLVPCLVACSPTLPATETVSSWQ